MNQTYRYDVYLAGPFFTEAQKLKMSKARSILEGLGFVIADPRDLGPVIVEMSAEARTKELYSAIYDGNIEGMHQSIMIVACTDDRDIGTAFEIGYFAALGRRIFTFSFEGYGSNVMIAQAANGHARNEYELKELMSGRKLQKQEATE
jgi:nucleoside 2-deoxyribosyltransferase